VHMETRWSSSCEGATQRSAESLSFYQPQTWPVDKSFKSSAQMVFAWTASSLIRMFPAYWAASELQACADTGQEESRSVAWLGERRQSRGLVLQAASNHENLEQP